MGYLYLTLALLAGVTKGYCGKKTSGSVAAYQDAMLVNALRMVLCIAIGFGLIAVQGDLSLLRVNLSTLLITALSGVTTSLFVVTWLLSVRKGAYMMVDVFLMMGTVAAVAMCGLFLGETVSLRQIVGLALLVAATVVMCSYSRGVKGKMTPAALVLLIVCGLSNGLTDFSQKLFVSHAPESTSAVFNFYTYVFSAAVLLVLYLAAGRKEQRPASAVVKPIWGYVLVMALCLYLNSFFKTEAASLLPAAQLYPLTQGCGMILSTMMAALCFGEKPNAKSVAGLGIAFAALLIINL